MWRELGWSYRQIEQATGIPKSTIELWCGEMKEESSGVQSWTPEQALPPEPARTLGLDGKRYPAERADEDERAALVW
ncbi:hypothetical protein NET02_16110 [Thermomicrobiaceae bacterium CFH 74404]|uniref:Uncharacterized protein n=1 Tax=Thermalbibacter longus TaxID=2951981 RepID=A0AA41WGH9_9BACT|nr:hypothetical protein [Thermalbibacter longus]MCM8750668.1 hypothetical protein [Thermalbibacter longus]